MSLPILKSSNPLATPEVHRSRERGFSAYKEVVDREHSVGPNDSAYDRANNAICRDVWDVLRRHFPDYPWYVGVSLYQGIVKIMMPAFSNYSYVLHTKSIDSPADLERKVRNAGGAFLECFGIPRLGFDPDTFQQALSKRPVGGQVDPREYHAEVHHQQSLTKAVRDIHARLQAMETA